MDCATPTKTKPEVVSHDNCDELIDIVDEHDNVIKAMGKDVSYKQGLHRRIVNVAVIDPITKKIAIQKRGAGVSWQPDHYCISACGHVGAGEDWDTAARRELHEEMGVDAPVTFIGKMPFTDEFGQHFILGIYTAEIPHGQLRGHSHEVGDVLFLTPGDIYALIAKGDKLHNLFIPVFETILSLATRDDLGSLKT